MRNGFSIGLGPPSISLAALYSMPINTQAGAASPWPTRCPLAASARPCLSGRAVSRAWRCQNPSCSEWVN